MQDQIDEPPKWNSSFLDFCFISMLLINFHVNLTHKLIQIRDIYYPFIKIGACVSGNILFN